VPCAFTRSTDSTRCSRGTIYETLDFVNALQNSKVTPWLATAYAWSNNNKTLTFTIRSGVKWTDGTPFSAADVAYTFNLLKKYRPRSQRGVVGALECQAEWLEQGGLRLLEVGRAYFYYVADQVPIVPEHI